MWLSLKITVCHKWEVTALTRVSQDSLAVSRRDSCPMVFISCFEAWWGQAACRGSWKVYPSFKGASSPPGFCIHMTSGASIPHPGNTEGALWDHWVGCHWASLSRHQDARTDPKQTSQWKFASQTMQPAVTSPPATQVPCPFPEDTDGPFLLK